MYQGNSESDCEDEERDEVDEQKRKIYQELLESDGEDEEQNIEEELVEGESQSIQAPMESAGSEEGHDEEDEQEMQIGQARSEYDSEDVEENVEEHLREEDVTAQNWYPKIWAKFSLFVELHHGIFI